MGKIENIAVFQDTQKLYQNTEELRTQTALSRRNQVCITEAMPLISQARDKYAKPLEIRVTGRRSFEVAKSYATLGGEFKDDSNVAVLNFASASHAGGGVENGASAQEESLCRISTLYPCLREDSLHEKFYKPHRVAHDPIHSDDCIYTPNVVVFKSDTSKPQTQERSEWYRVNVITCAAPNLRDTPSNKFNPFDGRDKAYLSYDEQRTLHEKRARRILNIAAMFGNDTVILGAFGCGVFSNDPRAVAEGMRNALMEFSHTFQTVEFAVYGGAVNYGAFADVFSSANIHKYFR